MTKVVWGEPTTRFFEAGIDQGVFYSPLTGIGVPWNGLISITEGAEGGEARPLYLDGFKRLNLQGLEEFTASIQSFYMPSGFEICDGSKQLSPGLFATQQRRKSFNFAYRTRIGNDVDATNHAYKLHLVYNALAAPSGKTRSTLADTSDPSPLSWEVSTKAPAATGIRPTAHFVVDSRFATPANMIELENKIYGTDLLDPVMPTVAELLAIFAS